jgi:hypothetical protein
MTLTVEDDVYAFLGNELRTNKATSMVTLTQSGLTEKVLRTTGMQDNNRKHTPAATIPLETDADGARFCEEWDYASVVGMFLYLSSNSRPDIQFTVHQCARFTHNPRKSHGEVVLRICQYLVGTQDQGLTFDPNSDLQLDCYVDADLSGLWNHEDDPDLSGLWNHEDDQDPACVKSRTGYVMTLEDVPCIGSRSCRHRSLSRLWQPSTLHCHNL